MFEAIKYNLANLGNFKGREGRSAFWFYVLFLVIINILVSIVISIALTGPMMADVFTTAQSGASEAEIQKHMFERMAGMMRASVWTSGAVSLVMTGLIAAAFTRRLHDSGKSGWIAAVTVALQLIAIALQIGSAEDAARMMSMMQTGNLAGVQELQASLMLRGLLGWVPVAVIIVFGVWPSNDGDNIYGPEPDHI